MEASTTKNETLLLDECIAHAKVVIAEQLEHIADKEKYDFAPQFRDMTIQLYLVGVMWQFYAPHETREDALEKAFAALTAMMVKDGVKPKAAEKKAAFLKKTSRLDDDEALAMALGYESTPGDKSLAEVFDHYLDEVRVSGELWRIFDQGKKVVLLGGMLFAMAGVWLVTLFLPESSNLTIFVTGLLMAFLFVIPASLVILLIYRYKIKQGKRLKSSPSETDD
ncbi:MAG: hypothetical protein RQ714_01315 [Nitrosomonas sp.]|nr:hypothetical protein [Nitrosomonas sp.]